MPSTFNPTPYTFNLLPMYFDKIYQYNFPTTIRFGPGASKELGDYLLKNDLLNPLIVTDNTVAQLDFFKEIISDLKNKKFQQKYSMTYTKIL